MTDTQIDLDDAGLYINRELSWLEFNRSVLAEALDEDQPLLERVRFLSIFASNLDEFFMIRVSGLRRQLEAGVLEAPPDGMKPAEQLAEIRRLLMPHLDKQNRVWRDDLMRGLAEAGVFVVEYDDLKKRQRKLLRRYFEKEIFPVLTPLAFDPAHPFPHISNLSLNLAVLIHDPRYGDRVARLKVPGVFPRLLRIPSEDAADEDLGLDEATGNTFVWLEQVIAANLETLFPGVTILAAHPFRVTRDADFEIEEDEAADLRAAIEEGVGARQFGSAIRLEVAEDMPQPIRDFLAGQLGLAPYLVYTSEGPLGLADVAQLADLDLLELKYPTFQPVLPATFAGEEDVFRAVRWQGSVLLYHPFDSFSPVVDYIRQAARDPAVLAIKQTLYRVGSNSPIVEALLEARENGKQVAVLVELKARFDEENNLVWARALEDAGVHVAYGMLGLKIHAKASLVVRRERAGIRRYVHLGTGNYNPVTARGYTDVGFFTVDEDIGADVSDLFNVLTGYARKHEYRKLLVAPESMRQPILDRIERETKRHAAHGDGHIIFKVNALVDKAIIRALYRASQAGVRVDLLVRGICCLRPGVPGVSETITVTSIVGRFLEHARILYFRNGGDEDILVGSADLMPRNLDRRVELLFPVEDDKLKVMLRDEVLHVQIRDNTKARQLQADGTYVRLEPPDPHSEVDAQHWMLENRGGWAGDPEIGERR